MRMILPPIFNANASARRLLPNRWDFVAFPLILCLIVLGSTGFHQTLAPMATLKTQAISLDPAHLPGYALRTILRMLAAMIASLVFTLVYGTIAAKSRRAEKVLVPILDILQSVPVLGYISFTVTFFLALFPGRVLGAECAAIFAIFTSQAWNMTFSFYQSLRTVPRDLEEVSIGFHLTGWQRFWKLEVPFSMPGLIWNMMMSMSGGWFFVVASEAITVGNNTVTLPGIGAYLAQAISERNLGAVGWVILAMTLVIVAYDQFLFRPLVAWADKFRMENTSSQNEPESWLLDLIRRARLIQKLGQPLGAFLRATARMPLRMPVAPRRKPVSTGSSRVGDIIWAALIVIGMVLIVWRVVGFMATEVSWGDVGHVVLLGLITLVRVLSLIAIASVVWVPLGVLIGLRPKLAEKIQPLAQFLAAFPANLLFPIFVVGIVHFNANPDIWLSPLIVLGTQWYILFNVIAGAMAIPTDLKEAASVFGFRGWERWQKLILPGIFPFLVTGMITASGGAWNASIVAEYFHFKGQTYSTTGIGAMISAATDAKNFDLLLASTIALAAVVVTTNRLLWRRLYRLAETRFKLES